MNTTTKARTAPKQASAQAVTNYSIIETPCFQLVSGGNVITLCTETYRGSGRKEPRTPIANTPEDRNRVADELELIVLALRGK